MICSKCGHIAAEGELYCIDCGAELVEESAVVSNADEAEEAVAEAVEEEEVTGYAADDEGEAVVEPAEAEAEAIPEEAVETAGEIVEEVEPNPEEPVETAEESADEAEPAMDAVEEAADEEISDTARALPEDEPAPVIEEIKEEAEDDDRDEKPVEVKRPEKKRYIPKIERPLSVWGFLWRIILFSIPVINIIPLFAFTLSSRTNKNSKNFASAVLILVLIGLVITVALIFLIVTYTDPDVLADFIEKYFKFSIR